MILSKSLIYIFLFYTLLFSSSVFAGKIDSLFLELQNQENEVEKISVLNQIGGELIQSNQDSADLFLNQGLQLASILLSNNEYVSKKHLIYLHKSNILSELGYISFLNSDYKRAIKYLNESIEIKESIYDFSYKIEFYNHLGICYFKLGDYNTSLDYFYKSLKFNEQEEAKALICQDIGNNYAKLELFDKAVEYYKLAIELAKNNPQIVAKSKNKLAEVYMATNKWTKSELAVNQAKNIFKTFKSKGIEESYAIHGRIKIQFNELDSSLHYLRVSERLCVKNNSKDQLMKVYHYYSLLYNKKGNMVEAVRYANKMQELAIGKKDIANEKIAFMLLYKIYEKNNDYENAFKNFQLYNEVKEELALDDAKNLLLKEEYKLEIEQQKLKDSLKFNSYNIIKNSQIESNKLELAQVKKTKGFLYGGLFILVIALFGFTRSLIRKKRDNLIILDQKKSVEEQQLLLASQNQKLQSKATLYKILQVCSSDNDIHKILKNVLNELLKVKLIGSENKGGIFTIGENKKIKLDAEEGLDESNVEGFNELSIDECVCGEVYKLRRIEYCTPLNGKNHFNVPIINNDEVQGIILLYTELSLERMIEAEEFFSSVSILLGETIYRHKISDKLRMAHIENTIKKKEIERANLKVNSSLQKQEAINDLMGAIIRNENVGEKVFNYTSELFQDTFIKRLNITLFDFEKGMVKFYFLRENGIDKIKNKEFPISEFSKETISTLKRNQRVIVNSIKDLKEPSESDLKMLKNNINAFASFPLMIDKSLLGSFNISFEDDIKFTEEQEEFISMLIEGITIAIHQNLLFTEISLKNDLLLDLNTEIKASINYAKKLQQSVLPTEEYFDKIFPNKFAFLKQKDTVGGDFYWVGEFEPGVKMIASVDCTGHGIPGAFMTMLSRVLLRETATIRGTRCPSQILTQIDLAIRRIFRQEDYNSMQDGMDMTICVIDENENKISFSAAQRPIVLKIKDNDSLVVVKGSKFAVGGFYEVEKTFDLLEYTLEEIEGFYLFSDGYVDQFGGPNIKKYSTRQFVNTLNIINEMPMNLQKRFLINEIENWKGELDQIDDILVIGVKLN